MRIIRRVTLRCICEDLDADWGNPGESRAFLHLRKVVNSECFDSEVALALECVPTTSLAAHPLIAGFHAAFEGNDPGLQRETISGLSDPYWLKQKTSRWRGAATDADVVGEGEVWLCAGGLRASGDARDFYARFMQGLCREAMLNGGIVTSPMRLTADSTLLKRSLRGVTLGLSRSDFPCSYAFIRRT